MNLSLISPTISLPIITISMVVTQTQIEKVWEKQLKDWRHHLFIILCFTTFYILQTVCIANVTIFTVEQLLICMSFQQLWYYATSNIFGGFCFLSHH